MRQANRARGISRGSPNEATKRKISETLTGQKFQGEYRINPEDGAELRKRIAEGDDFKYQKLVDWYRDLKDV